jgi:RimJ/RimL family protein N-acetyltransferase
LETVFTERLIVRRPVESDLHDFLAYRNHPENLKYQPIAPTTEEEASAFLARMAVAEFGDTGGWQMFAVELKSEGRMIGEVGVYLSPHPESRGDLGWSFHPDCHGYGYATEAAQVLLRYVFEERGLHRVTAGCDARNTPSFRLMERLGMRREAYFVQSQFADGAWHDTVAYALLRDEWDARQTLS